jgi:hypothetical protein
MTSGISSATNGLASAVSRVERAARAIASAFQGNAPNEPDLVYAEVDLITSRLQFSASLAALKASNEMLAEVIAIAGYGVSAGDARDPEPLPSH